MGKKNKDKNQREVTDANIMFKDEHRIYPNVIVNQSSKVAMTRFKPVGYGHDLQELISTKLHDLVMQNPGCDMTLAEMGYLHRIMILQEDGRIRIKIYFNPELATYKQTTPNGQYIIKPIPQLIIMNKYFFIIDDVNALPNVIKFEKALMPKGKVQYDELGKPTIKLKNDGTDLKYQETMYVECNFPMTIAAAMDINLDDPNYRVSASTLGKTNQKTKAIMIDGKENSFPIWIDLEFTSWDLDDSHAGYDTDSVVPYLLSLASKTKKAHTNYKTLATTVVDDAKKKKKDKSSKSSHSAKYC